LASGLENAVCLRDLSEVVAQTKADCEVERERKIECGFRTIRNATVKLAAYIYGAANHIDATAPSTCDGLGCQDRTAYATAARKRHLIR